MGRSSELAMDIAEAEEMRARLSVPLSRTLFEIIEDNSTDILDASVDLWNKADAVPQIFPLTERARSRLSNAVICLQAILKASETADGQPVKIAP